MTRRPARPQGGERSGGANVSLAGTRLSWGTVGHEQWLPWAQPPGLAFRLSWQCGLQESQRRTVRSRSRAPAHCVLLSWSRFDGPLSSTARLPRWVFISCVSALALTFMTWQRGCPSVPWPHSFLAVGMLASRQSQTFRFLWIPLTSVTPTILLQASYGDSPGSWNQNFPGDQITLESSLVPGSQEEPGFSYPHSCCLAWTLAWACQGGGAPTDASRNNDAVTLWWAPHHRNLGALSRLPAVYAPKRTCRHSDTLGQTHTDECLIYHAALFLHKEKVGIFFLPLR